MFYHVDISSTFVEYCRWNCLFAHVLFCLEERCNFLRFLHVFNHVLTRLHNLLARFFNVSTCSRFSRQGHVTTCLTTWRVHRRHKVLHVMCTPCAHSYVQSRNRTRVLSKSLFQEGPVHMLGILRILTSRSSRVRLFRYVNEHVSRHYSLFPSF